jgi:NitT/TauT family transport system substrate-binding protein
MVAGCTKGPEAKAPIKIAINVWPGYAHAFIAQEKGYFKKNGVNVELVLGRDYTVNTKRYTNGDVDGIFEVYTEAILQNSEGIPTRVVYVSDYSFTGDVIIGRPELKALADLKAKKFGIEGINTFSHLFVLAVLEKAGIREQDVRFEVVPASGVLDALESGRIDAGHTYEPTKTKALQMGYKILGNAGDVPGVITDVLVFKKSTIKNRPEEIKAVVKAMLEARDFVYAHKEEAIKIMAKSEDMSEDEMLNGVRGVHHLDLKENVKAMQKSDEPSSLFGSGKMITEFYLKRGQLSLLPDLDKIIEPRFVEELGK